MPPKATHPWTLQEAAHLIRRAGFGAAPAEIERIHQLGLDAAVDELLAALDADDAYPVPEWATQKSQALFFQQQEEERRKYREAQRNLDRDDQAGASRLAEQRRIAQRELRRVIETQTRTSHGSCLQQ